MRSPALQPVAAAPAPVVYTGPPTVESLGRQLREVLPTRRVHSVSVCDAEANVLWLSEGALGPDEHGMVCEALERLSVDTSLPCHEMGLEDGRLTLFLAVRAPDASLLGVAMVLADGRSLGDDTLERMSAQPVRTVLTRLATLMKPAEKPATAPTGNGAASNGAASNGAASNGAASNGAAGNGAAGNAPAGSGATSHRQPPEEAISADAVNEILEFELSPEDAGHARSPHAGADSATSSQGGRVHLEFVNDASAGAVEATAGSAGALHGRGWSSPVISIASAGEARAPVPSAAPAATTPTASGPAASATSITAPPAIATKPPSTPATTEPSATAANASDPNLLLEVLAFSKLRPGGQTRRFQVLARMAAPPRDPAVQDALVLQRLMSWLATHRPAWNTQPTGFTVSLSIATLEDDRFVQKLAAALNSHGIAPDTVGLEIAETLCTQQRAHVERFLAQCEKVGVWVVIDGFSFDAQTVPILRSKALRLVKIDPKLSSAALKDKLSQAMVVAAVQAAKVLGIHCAAQKVDSQAALQWLTAIGCDFAQGSVLGRAHSLDSIGTLPDTTAVTEHLRSSSRA